MGFNQLSSNENVPYNAVNAVKMFVADLVMNKMPIISSFYAAPQMTLEAGVYTKLPRSSGNVYSNTKGGMQWIEDGVTSFKFTNKRTMFAFLTVQFQNNQAANAQCYIRAQKNGAEARLVRIVTPANDEDSATLMLGYELDYDDQVTFEVYSSVAGVAMTRFSLIMIQAPNDSVSIPEMI